MKEWVSPGYIAKKIHVDVTTVQRWCHRPDNPAPHIRVGKVIRINIQEFEKWWESYRNHNEPDRLTDIIVALRREAQNGTD